MGWLVLRLAFLSIFAKNTHMIYIIYIYLMINAYLIGLEYDLKEFKIWSIPLVLLFLITLAFPILLIDTIITSFKRGGVMRRFYYMSKDWVKATFFFEEYFIKSDKGADFFKKNCFIFINTNFDTKGWIVKLHKLVAKKIIDKIELYEIRTRHTTK
jgi:hypothetical protein